MKRIGQPLVDRQAAKLPWPKLDIDGHASEQHNASFMIAPLLWLAFLFPFTFVDR